MYFHFKYILKGQKPFMYLRIVIEYYANIKANKIAAYEEIYKLYCYMKKQGIKI